MRKRVIFLMVALAPFFASRSFAQEIPSLDYLSQWEGSYPSMTKKLENIPVGKQFWDDPNVLAVMKKNIPVDVMKKIIMGWELKGEVVEMPILKKADVLAVEVCKPHDCASNSAHLYFNLKRKTVQLCWTETDAKTGKQIDSWIADKVKRLGVNACMIKNKFEGLAAYGDPKY